MKSSTVAPDMTIGIDLGDKHSHTCAIDSAGEIIEERRVRTRATDFMRALAGYPGARVILETGTHSGWVARELETAGYEVVVAHARRVQLITKSDRKNDRFDAEQLARLGRIDPKLLGPVKVRSEQAALDMGVVQVRHGLVKARAQLVNQARGLVKSFGQRLPSCSTKYFAKCIADKVEMDRYPGLAELVEVVGELSEKIGVLDRHIEKLCKERYEQTALLRQVPGVGPITALAYVLIVEDPERFERSRTVGSYLGLRPRQRDSGERRPELRITKGGNEFLRWLLVQAAHYVMGPFGPDSDLRRFGERLAGRGGTAAKKKAVVAVARKLAVLLHSLWRSGQVYEPLGYDSHGVLVAA